MVHHNNRLKLSFYNELVNEPAASSVVDGQNRKLPISWVRYVLWSVGWLNIKLVYPK